MEPCIIVHGGAGNIPAWRIPLKLDGCKKAAQVGYDILEATGNVIDAVEAAVRIMEDDEAFNAGFGSVLTMDGEVEMDAMIIRGSDLKTGGVGAVKHIANPITLAKLVMQKTNHCLLVSQGAEDFAKNEGIALVPSDSLISSYSKATLEKVLSKAIKPTTESGETGTVGAVAINRNGQMAAATSTGGIHGKLNGRVGDTPIPGGGTYCDDNVCGVSATGLGEAIMRTCLASRIANSIKNGMSACDATEEALSYMTSLIPEGDGGAIVITKTGDISKTYNSKMMSWACVKNGTLTFGS